MIKDNIQPQYLGGYKLPKLKGTVEIKLHNPTTGKTEIHRGENMITNAVSDIFASNYCGALDYRKLLPLYNKMYGGILCFSKQLNVDTEQGAADDYFIPDNHPTNGNPVTAHAGQTSFSTQDDDYTRGVPLPIVAEDGTVTFSWEWGLSGGNGTISALALTHKDVGDAGTGSTSQAFQALKPVINCNFGLSYTSISGDATLSRINPVMFIGADNYAYRFYCNRTTVTIIRFPIPYEQASLVSKPFSDSFATTHNVTTETTFEQVYMPLWFYDKTTNKLWLFYSRNSGTHIDCECIDISTYLATHVDITTDVTTGPFYNDGRDTGYYGYSGSQMPYCNGSVYLGVADYTHTTRFYRINLSNMADQEYISGLIQPFGGVFRPDRPHRVIVGKRFVINNSVSYPTSYDTPDRWITPNYHAGVSIYPFMYDQVGIANLGGQLEGGSSNQYYVGVSKFYLGTKYNLSSAVTKTPSQSMIVTYTLTEVAS